MKQKILHSLRSLYACIPFHIAVLTLVITGMQLYNYTTFGDPDGQYHITIAKVMSWWPTSTNFYWLPFTSWGSAFADQHYLFHVFLKPFALFNNGQIAVIVGFVGNLLAFNWLLKQTTSTVRTPWLWLYALGSSDLLVRINMVRAESTGMLFLFLSIGMLLKRQWHWLLPLTCVYTLWYGGSTVFMVFLGVYCLLESIQNRTLVIKPALYTLAGLLLALIIHPYRATFPALLYDQMTAAGFLRQIQGGTEWYGHRSLFLIDNIAVFLPWIMSIVYLLYKRRVDTISIWFFGICSVVFMEAGLKSTRMLLYWVPCAILFTAIVLAQPLKATLTKLSQNSTGRLTKILLVTLCACFLIRLAQNVYGISTAVHAQGISIYRLKPAAQWLASHTNPGDIITNATWHIFPELFYWNRSNRYITGEDPAFLWIGDADRYAEWASLQSKTLNAQTLVRVLRAFQSHWLIIPAGTKLPPLEGFLQKAYRDGEVEILYLIK